MVSVTIFTFVLSNHGRFSTQAYRLQLCLLSSKAVFASATAECVLGENR